MHRLRTSANRPLGIALILFIVGVAGFRLASLQRDEKPAFDRPPGSLVPVSFHQEAVPEAFEGGIAWINSAGPIRLADLRGKVVLLDFWTYCCINCHHVLPDLAKLEKKYANELVVIGVHTAKFDAERDTDNIRRKVAEYKIKHPVVNDANQVIWTRFGIQSWPSIVVLDPEGHYIDTLPGEGNYEILDRGLGKLVQKFRAAGKLNETPLHFESESDRPLDTPLAYPGKVLADAAGKRLFLSDTANNRIVITDLKGKLIATVGTGLIGHDDGAYDRATFQRPQGMYLDGKTLYVADTENHMIRAIDLEARTVATVAGTGEQSHQRPRSGPAKTTGLNSPWDLLMVPNHPQTLFIAMAGPHQLWKLDLDKGTVGVWAGTGRENIVDGDATSASFAQPSGLATDGKHLFVADSEGSCVRAVDLAPPHKVRTLVGTHDLPQGQSLFAFGDVDGQGSDARLQHCLGLAYANGTLYVADSYNNKVRVVDPSTRTITTLAGNVQGGSTDDPARFDEPGGLSVADGTLYVADTNNGLIRAIDLETKKVRTLALDGVKPPSPPKRKPVFPNPQVTTVAPVKVAPGDRFTLEVALKIPEGFKVSPDAPMPYLIETPGHPDALSSEAPPTGSRVSPPSAEFTAVVPLARPAAAGDTLKVKLSVSGFLCKENKLCQIHNYVWNIPVTFAADGASTVRLTNEPKKR